jgi:hypothetical protein
LIQPGLLDEVRREVRRAALERLLARPSSAARLRSLHVFAEVFVELRRKRGVAWVGLVRPFLQRTVQSARAFASFACTSLTSCRSCAS